MDVGVGVGGGGGGGKYILYETRIMNFTWCILPSCDARKLISYGGL